MLKSTHTGRRLRERRIALGLKQGALAARVGISPAYLNLIEHNKRRIGGKLLLDLARELQADPASLSEGAELAVVGALREAALRAAPDAPAPEHDKAEDLAARYPGWAALIAAQEVERAKLEELAAALTDRLTHDPFLPTALHEILSSVTSIRSTAGILANDAPVDPEWQARFHRNLYEDSQRLADGAQSLVAYLDDGEAAQASASTPQDEVEGWMAGQGFHLPALERGGVAAQAEARAMIEAADQLSTAPARQIATNWLTRYLRDASRMPLAQITAALGEVGPDPAAIAQRFDVSLPAAMRRMAALPAGTHGHHFGLVLCDGSGTLTFRESLEGFVLPRFGAACPLWPLYRALSQPGQPVRATVQMPGPPAQHFIAHAMCRARGPARFDSPPIYEATMLIRACDPPDGSDALPIGSSCRICPRSQCAARREPSLLAEGL